MIEEIKPIIHIKTNHKLIYFFICCFATRLRITRQQVWI